MKPNISSVLKALRKHSNNTQQEVADFLGISRQAYSRYESNIREPDMETLNKLATFYHVSPQVFYIRQIDKVIEPDMDIVEMVARYQLKKLVHEQTQTKEDSTLDTYIEKQDLQQIQVAMKQQFGLEAAVRTPTSKRKKRIVTYVFYALIVLFALNIGFMSLHRFDPNYEYNILNHSYVNAVTPDQDVNQTMYLDIVRITEFKATNIAVGDYVVIYSDFGLNEYFVEQVTAVDNDAQTITTTYDQVTSITNRFTEVTGIYEHEANLIGTIYYASKFPTGYLFISLGHIILLSMYYLSFIDVSQRSDR